MSNTITKIGFTQSANTTTKSVTTKPEKAPIVYGGKEITVREFKRVSLDAYLGVVGFYERKLTHDMAYCKVADIFRGFGYQFDELAFAMLCSYMAPISASKLTENGFRSRPKTVNAMRKLLKDGTFDQFDDTEIEFVVKDDTVTAPRKAKADELKALREQNAALQAQLAELLKRLPA